MAGTDAPGRPGSPIRATDDEALALARTLSRERVGALGTLDRGHPAVSRVALIVADGTPVLLTSDLSQHSRAMDADGRVSLLLGTSPGKGDPLAFPRITLFGTVAGVERGSCEHAALRTAWLAEHPKAFYVDFDDFRFHRLAVARASLNGGFGRAYELTDKEWAAALESDGPPG